MDPTNPLWHTFSALLGALVGGGITYLLNRQQLKNQLEVMRAQHKTEFVAEETARMLLSHRSFTDRSFEALQRALGGFEADELRKILVRAGATRVYREDGSEWWRLVARMDEFIERKELQRMADAVIPAQAGIEGAGSGGGSGSPPSRG
ncbi:MAG TPA: hypothetical protein VHA82_06060 [Ramlibacter sp.]|uniref:hypothetical protein n=1 Tax=Ramlibacter sp. TaxID=1917967 RepID=UPI002CC7AE96|nr:hypothetical protein [Ramlibacter sp.]HVZ43357.1 hypothetical protein [Ramlibacter sp.]